MSRSSFLRLSPWGVLLAAISSGSLLADVPVIPRPVQEKAPDGSPLTGYFRLAGQKDQAFVVQPGTVVAADASLANEKSILQGILKKLPAAKGKASSGGITLSIDAKLPKEGYVMKVSPKGIEIAGGSAAGVFYGIQSLNQMLIVGQAKGTGTAIPAMTLEDAPTCVWRGVMVDSARHFKDKEWMKKFIDLMALHKMNRLHWHLVDSEGWRLEIKKYPKLLEVAKGTPSTYPSEDPTDPSRPAKCMYGNFHGADYYSQEDIKEIVAYAKARHVEIMPEIEFPGHAMVALTAYPEFGTTGKAPSVKSNISVDLFSPSEKGLSFLKDVLDETMALFPFEVIHFGGDEAPKGQWKNSPEVQAQMKALGLKNEDEMQAWMFNELAKHIAKQGRRPMGWEEIMHGSNMDHLTKSAIIMPWLSRQNAIKSANGGHGIVHCSVGPFYLDSWQTDSPADNWSLYKGPFTLEMIYNYDLFPQGLTEEGRKNVYGAQGQLWSELMPKTEHVEYQAFPRVTAIAELTWTPKERKDYKDYYKRLVDHANVLDAYKVNYRFIDPLPAGEWSSGDLAGSEFTLDLPQLTDKSSGEVIAKFDYKKGGSRLEIKKVELLRDGKSISADEHDGFSGTHKQDHVYRLKIAKASPGKYALKVTHANAASGRDSQGEVTVYSGKGVELFNPRNFKGGDYPTMFWTSDDTKSETVELRIPMDGVVLAPGAYELSFELKQPKSPVTVSGIRVQGTSGKGSASDASLSLSGDSTSGMVPFAVRPGDVQAGNSIVFDVKSAQPSSGDVRVRLVKELASAGAGKYEWSPEVLQGGPAVTYVKGASPRKDGVMNLSFDYTGGGNGLDIKSVQVLDKGRVIAESKQAGFAGGRSKQNRYTLSSPELKVGGAYQVRLVIAGAGGSDSRGVLSID